MQILAISLSSAQLIVRRDFYNWAAKLKIPIMEKKDSQIYEIQTKWS